MLTELINKPASNYFEEKGIIIAAAKLADWETLKEYDDISWMNEIEFAELGLNEETILVAFRNDENPKEPIGVYVFGDEGVDLLMPM